MNSSIKPTKQPTNQPTIYSEHVMLLKAHSQRKIRFLLCLILFLYLGTNLRLEFSISPLFLDKIRKMRVPNRGTVIPNQGMVIPNRGTVVPNQRTVI